MTHSFLYAVIALLVILDPAGTAALFAAMTPQDGYAERAEQARRACLIAFAVLALFVIAGEELLRALGVGLPAIRGAGGALRFLTAADMVRARGGVRVDAREQQAAGVTPDDISVFPLAIPLLAGRRDCSARRGRASRAGYWACCSRRWRRSSRWRGCGRC